MGLSDDLISNYFELNYNFIIVAASPAKEGTFFDRKDGCLLLRLLLRATLSNISRRVLHGWSAKGCLGRLDIISFSEKVDILLLST